MSLNSSYKGDYKFKWGEFPFMKLSGLEPLVVTPETNFVIGERANVTGSKKISSFNKRRRF